MSQSCTPYVSTRRAPTLEAGVLGRVTSGRACGGWEPDLDSQAAAGSGFGVDRGAVGVGDRLHDREPEPDPFDRGASVGVASLEGLEDAGELAGRYHGSGVRDREPGTASDGVCGGVESASGCVVTDGVLYQVRYEPLDQQWVTGCSGGFEPRGAPQCAMDVRS